MYRPEGWTNTYRDDNIIGCACRGAYEAGADAMLKALRLMSKNLTDGCGNINSIYKYVRIPDDKVVPGITPSLPLATYKNVQ